MIVILMKDVKGTGKAGDVVKVSDGYARNMLLPKGLAKEASDGNIRNLEKQKEIAAAKRAEQKAAAQETAEKLEKIKNGADSSVWIDLQEWGSYLDEKRNALLVFMKENPAAE